MIDVDQVLDEPTEYVRPKKSGASLREITGPCACTRTVWCDVHRNVATPTQRAKRGPVERTHSGAVVLSPA